ncbi:hypothetical protein F5Y12DRAFT_467522 [Xylaria sp. FL1777]|nr:hypothetical protein F5Y12DRAFT_467522 [Xylaria sp. FL1777]
MLSALSWSPTVYLPLTLSQSKAMLFSCPRLDITAFFKTTTRKPSMRHGEEGKSITARLQLDTQFPIQRSILNQLGLRTLTYSTSTSIYPIPYQSTNVAQAPHLNKRLLISAVKSINEI